MLIAASYESLADQNEGVESIMDALLNQFDDNVPLACAAQASVLPVEVVAVPVSTATKSLACFKVVIRARQCFSGHRPRHSRGRAGPAMVQIPRETAVRSDPKF